MMRKGRELVDGGRSSSGRPSRSKHEMLFHREGIEEQERGSIRRLPVEEGGVGLVTMNRNGDGELRNFLQFSDRGFPLRDTDTTSKFDWKYLLKKSGNSIVDGVERGFQDSGRANYGRKNGGFVDELIPAESEMVRSLPTFGYNAGSAECRGCTRNVTGRSVKDSDYHGCSGNVVTDFTTEDAKCHRHTRNRTGLRIEDAEYNGHTRNMTGLRIEDVDYNEHTRNMTGFPAEDAEYNGFSSEGTGLPVEEAEYHRRTRTLMAGRLAEDGGRYLVRDYQQHMDRDISVESLGERNYLRFRNGDSSRSLTPRSQSSSQHTPIQGIPLSNLEGPCQEVYPHPADGLETGGTIAPSRRYSSHRIVFSKAGSNACPISNEGSTYLSAEHNSNMARHEYILSESQRSGKVYGRASSENTYDKYENRQDYNNPGDTFGNYPLGSALPSHDCSTNSCNCALEADGIHSCEHPLQEAPIVNIDGISRTAHEMEYGGVNLKSMDSFLEYQDKACYETTFCEEEFPYDVDADGASYEDQTWIPPILEEGAISMDENAQQMLGSGDIDLHDQPKRMPKRKRGLAGKMSWPKRRISTLGGSGPLSYDNMPPSADSENELVSSIRGSSHHFYSKENAGMSKKESRLPFGGLSKELQSRLSKPCESGSNDIKNRLKHPRFTTPPYGPQASKFLRGNDNSCFKSSLNVNYTLFDSQSHGKAKRTSIKKKLKSAPYMDVCPSDSQVSPPGLDKKSQQKLAVKNSRSIKEVDLPQEDPEYSTLKVRPTEKDPPENSEELKRQVNNWFLKCMLYLNTNPGRQKKLKEQGKAGTLKCIICSSSKEFIQTKDVAMHAFTSLKVGFRAAHLGFHRALCALMGWDPTIVSYGRWISKSLSDVEAWAIKEDIIVWPPVVIIHIGSARDFYDNEQVKIPIEQLENILRDMGLSEGKNTVHHGKPGDPNIMLVKFNGTLSGLQEAERLHNVFFEKKHGRNELQEVDAGIGHNKGVAKKPEDKVEDTLYGYLGIVEDFDKLNYDMRRHCVAKSKKEILACVDTAG